MPKITLCDVDRERQELLIQIGENQPSFWVKFSDTHSRGMEKSETTVGLTEDRVAKARSAYGETDRWREIRDEACDEIYPREEELQTEIKDSWKDLVYYSYELMFDSLEESEKDD